MNIRILTPSRDRLDHNLGAYYPEVRDLISLGDTEISELPCLMVKVKSIATVVWELV